MASKPASAAKSAKSSASKRQRDEGTKSALDNGTELAQKGGRTAASADGLAGSAKKVAAADLNAKETNQVSAPPRSAAEKADEDVSRRGRNGKEVGGGVGSSGKAPGIMRVSDLSAGQRQSRAPGKGGAKSLPKFSGAAATLNSGTTLFPSP